MVGGCVYFSFHRKGSKFGFRARLDPKNTATEKTSDASFTFKNAQIFCKKKFIHISDSALVEARARNLRVASSNNAVVLLFLSIHQCI